MSSEKYSDATLQRVSGLINHRIIHKLSIYVGDIPTAEWDWEAFKDVLAAYEPSITELALYGPLTQAPTVLSNLIELIEDNNCKFVCLDFDQTNRTESQVDQIRYGLERNFTITQIRPDIKSLNLFAQRNAELHELEKKRSVKRVKEPVIDVLQGNLSMTAIPAGVPSPVNSGLPENDFRANYEKESRFSGLSEEKSAGIAASMMVDYNDDISCLRNLRDDNEFISDLSTVFSKYHSSEEVGTMIDLYKQKRLGQQPGILVDSPTTNLPDVKANFIG